ncbi:MAG TPA: hypothetical protein PKC43_12190 [Phycisphaerales bacterium]|nr:hypothetical protein [Phycisphaerales bacterium]HMP38192.1 hypothetical protein [Phycisphaerales bacterium]
MATITSRRSPLTAPKSVAASIGIGFVSLMIAAAAASAAAAPPRGGPPPEPGRGMRAADGEGAQRRPARAGGGGQRRAADERGERPAPPAPPEAPERPRAALAELLESLDAEERDALRALLRERVELRAQVEERGQRATPEGRRPDHRAGRAAGRVERTGEWRPERRIERRIERRMERRELLRDRFERMSPQERRSAVALRRLMIERALERPWRGALGDPRAADRFEGPRRAPERTMEPRGPRPPEGRSSGRGVRPDPQPDARPLPRPLREAPPGGGAPHRRGAGAHEGPELAERAKRAGTPRAAPVWDRLPPAPRAEIAEIIRDRWQARAEARPAERPRGSRR